MKKNYKIKHILIYEGEILAQSFNVAMSWWHLQMETFSALLALCAGNSPVPREFPSERPVTQSFDVFFDLCLSKRLSKQSWGWWFETPSCPLWRHCNVVVFKPSKIRVPKYWIVFSTEQSSENTLLFVCEKLNRKCSALQCLRVEAGVLEGPSYTAVCNFFSNQWKYIQNTLIPSHRGANTDRFGLSQHSQETLHRDIASLVTSETNVLRMYSSLRLRTIFST